VAFFHDIIDEQSLLSRWEVKSFFTGLVFLPALAPGDLVVKHPLYRTFNVAGAGIF
jgi:hypothetical protein